jgi:hypothetical protein
MRGSERGKTGPGLNPVVRNDEEKQAAQLGALIQELIISRQNLAGATDNVWVRRTQHQFGNNPNALLVS